MRLSSDLVLDFIHIFMEEKKKKEERLEKVEMKIVSSQKRLAEDPLHSNPNFTVKQHFYRREKLQPE